MKKKTTLILKDTLHNFAGKQTYVVLFSDKEETYYLPVFLGEYEYFEITRMVQKEKSFRPSTSEFVCDLLAYSDTNIQEITITDFFEGLFTVDVQIKRKRKEIIHSNIRTSDAIMLSLQLNIPIFVRYDLLKNVGLLKEVVEQSTSQNKVQHAIKRLISQMDEAISKEDYLKAAELKVTIDKLKEDIKQ